MNKIEKWEKSLEDYKKLKENALNDSIDTGSPSLQQKFKARCQKYDACIFLCQEFIKDLQHA